MALLNYDLHEFFLRILGRLANVPRKVNCYPNKFFWSLGKVFGMSKKCPKIVFGKLEKLLGKLADILKRLNYYPNEISDDPSDVWQTKALKRFLNNSDCFLETWEG